jgi:hypothetical protein
VLATWIVIAVLALRLAVQVPLYFMGPDALVALGTARLVMGVPLYALGLWLAWMVSRPVGGAVVGGGTAAPGSQH